VRHAVVILILAASCGCATIRRSLDTPVGDLGEEPFAGQHYYAVLDAFGPPLQISTLPDGFVFLYDAMTVTEYQLGFSPVQLWEVDLLKVSFGRARLKQTYFVLLFDRDGNERTSGLYTVQKKIGGSFILQPVFTVLPTTDMSYLEIPPVQQDWGLSLLEQPPIGLNAAQDFGSGEAGVEVRGAPTAVGQHSLEMTPDENRRR